MHKFRAILLVLASLSLIFLGIAVAKSPKCVETINIKEAANKVKSIVNKYFVPNKDAILSGEPTEESGLYKVSLSVNNRVDDFYLTKDAALLIFPNGVIDIAKFEKDVVKQREAAKEEIPKKKKPTVELFVMSLCPYGIKAEKKILPVIKSFGDKVDFKIKFIVDVKGSAINEVDSLHGNDEVKEDVRQASIMKYYPDKFQSYIEKIDANSCVISCGAVKLEDYWKKTAKKLGMNVQKIESFAYGQEGLNLLKENETDVKKYAVTGSLTLVINGVKSSAVSRGAGALEQAICSAFTDSPTVCKKNSKADIQ